MNRTRRVATSLAALIPIALLAAAQAAHAGDPVLAQATVDVTPYPAYWEACGTGFVDDGTTIVGLWLFELDGARFDGEPIHHSVVVGGATYPERCFKIPRGTLGGSFEATLSFAGAGTSDFTAFAVGAAAWGPIVGDLATSTG